MNIDFSKLETLTDEDDNIVGYINGEDIIDGEENVIGRVDAEGELHFFDEEDEFEDDTPQEPKTSWTQRLKDKFSDSVGTPFGKYIGTPVKCAFDIVAMPYRDAYVYPFDNLRGERLSTKQRIAEGTGELAVNAGVGGGSMFAAGFFLPIFPVSTTLITLGALYGKPVVSRGINALTTGKQSASKRRRTQQEKNMFFPSLKK